MAKPIPSTPPGASDPPGRDPGASDEERGAQFRLSETLRRLKEKEGSFAALARAITAANLGSAPADPSTGDVIDRRKLKTLVEGPLTAVLTVGDLLKLDRYLSQFGESLALRPILKRPDLMDALAVPRRVTFLLGSKPEFERRMVSENDVLAMGEIQRSVGFAESAPRFEVKTVPLDSRRDLPEQIAAFEHLVHEESGPSLVALASHRSNLFSELLGCAMFGYPVFGKGPLPAGAKPPFRLVWSQKLADVPESHFSADLRTLRERAPEIADEVAAGKASVLLTESDHYVDRVTPRGWGESYGVCVAQRRRRGQVWLLLLGITGAATYACAKLANRLATRMGEVPEGEDSPIYWGIVRIRVDEEQRKQLFDLRQFAEEEIWNQTPLPAPQRGAVSL
ncbi:MAG: hypothetical protein ACYTJ0_17700 [Planctomycetota bacterium]|jgi:hypothetical protein